MKTIEDIKEMYDIVGHNEEPVNIPDKPENGLVLIVGSSGSGKSTILRNWFTTVDINIDNSKTTIENFSSIDAGDSLLRAFGLRSIPTWFRPPSTLSNGEYHRFECAKSIDCGVKYIDEFTSVVDRDTAKSLANSLRKWFKDGLLVVASCHHDIEDWLLPDIIYDTDTQEFKNRRLLRRPPIRVEIRRAEYKDWAIFKKHHYLSSSLSKSCHMYVAYINKKEVGFVAVIHGTGRDIKSYWRESRLVVLPEFQGLGIGMAISEAIAEEYISDGKRYFSKTSHSSVGEYRNASLKWRNTSTNMKRRPSYIKSDGTARIQKGFGKTIESIYRDANRLCYSHEYIGGHNERHKT